VKPLLLLVDDDTTFASLFGRALERRGIDSMHAADAEAARTLISQLRFTHAVIDLNLGGGDSGLVVLRHLRAEQPACRAVILTGFASIATAVEATRSGAVHYLPKPATVDEVLALLAEGPAEQDPPIPDRPLHPRRLEWEYIQRVLLEHDGNISATARALGMHRRTLQRKLAKYPPRP